MEDPGDIMEEIYALPPRMKYNESWLEIKGKRGFTEYWAVLKGTYIFFFKDQNTHVKEQYAGFIPIEVQHTKCTAKKGSVREFRVEMTKKKFLLRVEHDMLQKRWIHAINLVNRADAPGPLPGDPDFKEIIDLTPAPDKMKKRANTIATSSSQRPTLDDGGETSGLSRDDLSLDLGQCSLETNPDIKEEEEEEKVYDPIFVFPKWYYPNMTRQEAEQIMADQRHGSYLLRDSNKKKSIYAITIKDIGRMKHHQIELKSTSGECSFVSSPSVRLPNLLQAVDQLMKNNYNYLNAQPVCIYDRSSGDGEETIIHTESPRRDSLKSTPESPVSPVNGYASDSQNNTYMPRLSYPSQQQPPYKSVSQRKANSLPAGAIGSIAPLGFLGYENRQIIERHFRSTEGESYIDMKPCVNENNNFLDETGTVEAPPPLPRKKQSIKGHRYTDHIYENVPFVYTNNEFSYYSSSVPNDTSFGHDVNSI